MKRTLIGVALLAAAPLLAQQAASPAPAPADAELVVAKINDEVITRATLNHLWNRLGPRAQQQYEKSGGGKAGFLDNYVRKRLLLQKAAASGFDKKANVQAELAAARESALFDYYVREVIASQVVTDAEIRKYYDENPAQFTFGERRYLRYLVVKTKDRGAPAAHEKIAPVFGQLFAELSKALSGKRPPVEFGEKFSELARKHSEDAATAGSGGEIGWFEKSQLDPKIAEVVFALPVGQMSGILDAEAGLTIIYVEAVRPPEKEAFEEARSDIREYLLSMNMSKIVEIVNQNTAALRASGKVTLFPENVH